MLLLVEPYPSMPTSHHIQDDAVQGPHFSSETKREAFIIWFIEQKTRAIPQCLSSTNELWNDLPIFFLCL